MKNIFIIFLFITASSYTQNTRIISWETKTKKISDKEYELVINASLKENYHLYSQNVPEGGPIPTIFNYQKNKKYRLIGKTIEQKGQTKYDPVFGKEIKSFVNKAVFTQRIKTIGKRSFKIIIDISYMTCNDVSCTKETEKIELKIN